MDQPPKQISIHSLNKRALRLGRLALGMVQEMFIWEKATGPFSKDEQKAYLAALQKTLEGLREAHYQIGRMVKTADASAEAEARGKGRGGRG